jgi:hypothetical protein
MSQFLLVKGKGRVRDAVFTFELPALDAFPGLSVGCESCHPIRIKLREILAFAKIGSPSTIIG